MQVTLCQLDIVWEDKAANHRRVRALLDMAPIPPESLIVLPEMFATGYSMDVAAVEEGPDRRDERLLAELAAQYRAWVLGGVVTRHPTGKGQNQAVVFSPAGTEVARYTKMYPMTVAGEAEHYAAGDRVVTFDWAGVTTAPLICYDLRFPEAFRAGVRQGAELFVVIANFPAVREAHWLALLTARAIENQAYVVGVNRCGGDPQLAYSGRSVVIDPRGRCVADAGNTEGLTHATLDLPDLRAYRDKFPALQDMRGISDS